MKRIILIVGILSLVLLGFGPVVGSAQAAAADVLLNLSFSDIEDYVTKDNLTVRNNRETIRMLNDSNSDSAVSALWSSRSQLSSLQTATNELRKTVEAGLAEAPLDPALNSAAIALGSSSFSLALSMAQIDAQIDQFYSASNASTDKTVQQLESANKQIIWGAESLVMGYHTLSRQLDQSKENLKMLSRNIEVLEKRHSLGQITKTTLQNSIDNRAQLELSIKSMGNELLNLSGQINLLLGRAHDARLQIKPLPDANRDFLKTIDRTRDLSLAKDRNHLVNIAMIDIDEHSKAIGKNAKTQEGIAMNNLLSEQRSVELKYESLTRAIADKVAVLSLAESQLNQSKQIAEQAKVRYNLGIASKLELEQAESAVIVNKINLNSANAELLSVIRQYEWLVRGFSA